MSRGQSISLFLMNGTTNGIIKCSIPNRKEVAHKIPRTELDKCREIRDLTQSGVYFLLGETDDAEKYAVYIGQANNILNRLYEHERNLEKDYWTDTIVITKSDNSLGFTEISYLENKFYNLAVKTN